MGAKHPKSLYIYFACLSGCLYVCLFVFNRRQNGWTYRAQIFVGLHMTPGKVCGWSKFQKFSLSVESSWIFFFIKSATFFCFSFTMYTIHAVYTEKMFNWNRRLYYIYVLYEILNQSCSGERGSLYHRIRRITSQRCSNCCPLPHVRGLCRDRGEEPRRHRYCQGVRQLHRCGGGRNHYRYYLGICYWIRYKVNIPYYISKNM